ncbi:MAG: ATP-binding protein [Desulfobulbaceae bacterium]|nr:ATP-binding protein [Desulfobulbaceae bacterium]
MKIRNRITLWITGVGILASLLFSLVVFYEMIEQPYDLLDAELDIQAHSLLSVLEPQAGTASLMPESMLLSVGRLYWFKVFDEQYDVVYESEMSRFIDIPFLAQQNGYTITSRPGNFSRKIFNLDQDDSDEVTFRVRVFTIKAGGHSYTVQIAKSMGNLKEEISELLLTLLFGFIASAIILVSVGYYVAGQILKPISTINNLAREINDKTLDKRIPLGEKRDELYNLSSSLNSMFDRLQHSFIRQKEFVASASHELKTPITMLRLFFDDTVRRQSIPESFREKLMIQEAALSRMDQLVKNLLDLSALELKNTYEPEEYDLAGQIDSVLKEFTEIFETENIRVAVNMPEKFFIYADREKIRRVLINLIDNAIKYNHKDGEIQLQVEDDNNIINLELYNTGTGIPPGELKNVFDQFYRVEKSRSIAHGGSGLGLSIVKRIIELHGGTISMESKAGLWAKVRIVLPK